MPKTRHMRKREMETTENIVAGGENSGVVGKTGAFGDAVSAAELGQKVVFGKSSGSVKYGENNSRTFPLQTRNNPTTEQQKKSLTVRSKNVTQVHKKTCRPMDSGGKKDTMFTKCSVSLSPLDMSFLPTPESFISDSSMTSATTNMSTMSTAQFSGNNDYSIISTGVFPAVPEGVVDIDGKWDWFAPSTYARECMEYLMRLERRSVLPPGFLSNSPEVTPRMRGVLMDWLLQVQEHEELQDETLHVCRMLIDRVLAQGGVTMATLQLVGITCLLIASKFCERFCTEIKTLCYLTDMTYVENDVKDLERTVLTQLDFDITAPACTYFLERYLMFGSGLVVTRHLAMYLLDLSVTSDKLATVLASKMAASALLLARRLLIMASSEPHMDLDDHNDAGATASYLPVTGRRRRRDYDKDDDACVAWPRGLHFYTGYEECELEAEVIEMHSLLVRAPTSKFQGARLKYNTKAHSFISHDPAVNISSSDHSTLYLMFGKETPFRAA